MQGRSLDVLLCAILVFPHHGFRVRSQILGLAAIKVAFAFVMFKQLLLFPGFCLHLPGFVLEVPAQRVVVIARACILRGLAHGCILDGVVGADLGA